MDALCLFVAGALAARLSADEFTLAWTHSVQKTRWEEHWRVDGEALRLTEASVEGTGAGMEPPPEATFHDGRWTWRPNRTIPELALRHSSFAPAYALCTRTGCATLSYWAGPTGEDRVVTLRACRGRE